METFDGELEWGEVTQHASKIIILACGPSLRQIDIRYLENPIFDDVHVMAINRAHDWTDRSNSFFTLDPNDWFYDMVTTRMRSEMMYYVGVPEDYGRRDSRWVTHRSPAVKGPVYLHREIGYGPMRSRRGLSRFSNAIHTGNSAYGALGVAYHMCCNHPDPSLHKKIVVLGLDGTKEPYAYDSGKPAGSFRHLPALFESAKPQLDKNRVCVVNGNTFSNISCFSRLKAMDALEWLVAE